MWPRSGLLPRWITHVSTMNDQLLIKSAMIYTLRFIYFIQRGAGVLHGLRAPRPDFIIVKKIKESRAGVALRSLCSRTRQRRSQT